MTREAYLPEVRSAVAIALISLFAAGCGQIPSNEYIYKRACDALKTAPGVPDGATPCRFELAEISVGKNAAWVELAYDVADQSGQKTNGVEIIWFKRVARTWVVDHSCPRSRFSASQ